MNQSKSARKPTENPATFKKRREQTVQKIIQKYGQQTALLVAAAPEAIRNHDVHYLHRQDSNMYYLTGFEEPESVLLLRPGRKPESVMFVREKDIERETWDGFRYGPAGTKQEFGIDEVYSIHEFTTKFVELMKDYHEVLYTLFKAPENDFWIQKAIVDLKKSSGRSGFGLLTIRDADTFLGESRLIKDESGLKNQRQACQITAEAHAMAMKKVKPGMTERQIQAIFSYEFFNKGCPRDGYNAIVASGNNATTLHYNFNDQVCESGELLLIDAGCEYNYFSGDITRTFPVNGKFTDAQKKVYNGVLKVQKKLIEMVKPGLPFKSLHDTATDMLVDLMLDLSLVSGRKEDVIKSLEYKKYYPHGAGHWLGMDVHDAGLYYVKGEPRPLEKGMVFTIEPGLYIPATDTTAPKELRGIGIRIEDNILVTENGHEVLTSAVPKEVDDIENLMKS